MKRLFFLGAILGTAAALAVACFFVVTTLVWLVRRWEPATWVVWSVGLGLMAFVLGMIWRWWRLPVEERFRFSLRGMLLGITFFALWFGTAGMDFREWSPRNRARWEIFHAGGAVEKMPPWPDKYSVTRYWLFRFTGYDPWWNPDDADIRNDRAMSVLMANAEEFPDIEIISLGGNVTDASLAQVGGFERFPKVWFCQVASPAVTDAGLKHLVECRGLRGVNLGGCAGITDAGLAHLVEMDLERLRLCHVGPRTMPITDAGLVHVGRMHELKHLAIQGPVTDAGLRSLHGLVNLEQISLWDSRVTERGYVALCEALPDCHIHWEDERFPHLSQIERIEAWHSGVHGRRIVTIADEDRIEAVRSWLRDYEGRPGHWRGVKQTDYDGPSGASLTLRFEGQNRTILEVPFGGGVYHVNEFVYRPMLPTDEEDLCLVLGLDRAKRGESGKP